jgi:hypothetical protein
MKKLLVIIGVAVGIALGLSACNDTSSSSPNSYRNRGSTGDGYQQPDSNYGGGGGTSDYGKFDGGNTDRFDPKPPQGPNSPDGAGRY